jgi:hypothetical protein
MSLAFALVGTFVLGVGCSQGEGDRCQIDSDCNSGLVCRGGPKNGICQPSTIPGTGGSTGQDAAGPASTSDAASDVPMATSDAASDVTVGGDTAPDAEAADDSSAAD